MTKKYTMKKIILACVTAIFSLSFVNAQEEVAVEAVKNDSAIKTQPEVAPQAEPALLADSALVEDTIIPVKTRPLMLGVAAGVNMTNYSGDLEGANFGLGFQLAIGCDVPTGINLLRGYFSINPEMAFAYKTIGLDANAFGMESTDRIWSMNIPVYVKWNKSAGSGFFHVAVGPTLNVNLGGSNKWKESMEVAVEDRTRTIDQMPLFQADPDLHNEVIALNPFFGNSLRDNALYNILGFSLNFKAGYDFSSGLSITAGYQLGLSDMTNKVVYDDCNKKVNEFNQKLKTDLDKMEEAGDLTTQEKNDLYKEKAASNLTAPIIKNSSIFLTIGYVF